MLESAKLFLDSVEIKLRAKAYRTIELLKQFGPFLREPHSKSLRDYEGLSELRIKQGSNICRLFYFFYENKIYVITSGYVKKSPKMNRKEAKKAYELMNQFLEESHD